MWKSRHLNKHLVYLLRHAPHESGLSPNKGGWWLTDIVLPEYLRIICAG